MSFHLYRINELFSSADGTVQFIEMRVGTAVDAESHWSGISITSSQGGVVHSFTFPADLPARPASNTTVLIATQGFANLGIATPDFIVQDGFLFTGGGTLNFAGVDSIIYGALPSDGTHSVSRTGVSATATPTNFFGVAGTLPLPNHAPTGAVGVTGTLAQGETLAADTTTLADSDGLGTLAYHWKAGGVDIGGATTSTFQLTQAQVGAAISVTVSYTDGLGHAESVSGNATGTVANVNDLPTGALTISGNAVQGSTLSAVSTLADADGLGTLSYRWQAAGQDIPGATADSYLLQLADVGKTVSVIAGYVDGAGTPESVASATTAVAAGLATRTTGSDTFAGGAGDDNFDGGDGDDTFDGGPGADTLTGGAGNDTVDYSASGDSVIVSLAIATPQAISATQGTDTLTGIENLVGGAFNDTLAGDAANNTLTGNAGNDTMTGGDGFDTLNGGDGNDSLSGMAQGDSISGGNGDDFLGGGKGLDILDGGEGNDTLVGGLGTDTLIGGNGFDSLEGGDGDDSLSGMNQGDVINGGNGNDFLGGGKGLDILDGGEGNDTLQGGLGTDELTGGNGADKFVFSTALDGSLNVDTITDFTSDIDQIQLSAAIFTACAGQVGQVIGLGPNLTYNTATGALAYDADGAGPGTALKFAILGTSAHPSTLGADFLVIA